MNKNKAMYVVDKDYKIVYANKYFKNKYPTCLEGECCYEVIKGLKKPCEHCPKLNLKGESSYYDFRTNEWINANACELDDGKTAIFLKSWVEQKNIDQVFNVSVRDIVKSLSENNLYQGILVANYDERAEILYANNKMLEILGFDSYDEFVKATDNSLINLMTDGDKIANQEYSSLVQEGLIYSTVYDLLNKNKEFIKVFVKAQVIKDENGRLIIVGLVTNLSDSISTKAFVESENRTKIEQNQLINYIDEVFPGGYHKCIFDKDLTMVEMSSRFLELIGYTKEDIINVFDGKYINLIHPDDIDEMRHQKGAIEKACRDDKLLNYTYRIRNKEKGYIWVNNTARYCEVENEKFFQSAIIDVTDKKEKQFELEKQNYQLNLVLGNIPGGFNICYDDEDEYEYIYISNELASLFGYTADELREKTNNKAINLSLKEDCGYLDILKSSLKNDGDYKVRYRVRCKDGSLKNIINYGKRAFDKNGKPIIYSYLLDITEEEENKQLIDLQNRLLEHEREKSIEREKILQQSELIQTLAKDFSTVLCLNMENEITSLVYSESDEHPISMMEKYYKHHRYTESMEAYIRDYVYFDDMDEFRKNISIENIVDRMGHDSVFVYNYRKGKNKNPEYYQVKIVRVGNSDSPLVIIGYKNVDKTTREMIKQKMILSDALAEAQYASRAKTTFLSNMSHDIRTPMNAIIGYTSLAENNLDNKNKIQDYLKKINQSSTHLLSLINDVLDMSRIESGKIKIDNQPEKLSDIIHNVRNIIQTNVISRGLDLYMDTVDVIHEDIMCDKLRLNQVLINLLSNSMKFTKPGGRISLKIIEHDTTPDDYVNYEFIVNDTGIGMSSEFVSHIFEPFVREKSSTVSGIVGTGLGMSITKSIVDMLGGSISVKSELGRGTEFRIRLKFKMIGNDLDLNKDLDKLIGCRALIIGGDKLYQDNTYNILKDIGMNPECATLGSEGILRVKEALNDNNRFLVYVVDLMALDIRGTDLVREISSLDSNKPIIILSGYDFSTLDDDLSQGLEARLIAKPIFPSDLRRELRRALNPSMYSIEEKKDLGLNRFKGKRLLLAEDNLFNQEIAIEILKNMGFLVEAAENGKVAIDKLMDHDAGYFDAILMDIQMPIMDGFAATRVIRNLDNQILKNIPIIAMTANAFKEDEEKAIEGGMNSFVSKPVNIKKMVEIFERIF